MMKYISKLICLLGVSVFVGISVLYITNIVNGNQIKVPTQLDLHRPALQSLFLGNRGQQASITVTDDKLSIFNGLIMGEGNFASSKASLVTIGGGSSNSLGDVEKSGIGGGNNNSINTNFSVIGGGSGNTTSGDSSQGVAIAGGMNNQAGNGGAILGGEDNVVDGTGVILGGQNNTLQGNGIALGSNSNGGDGSFSWNSPYSQDSSAVIVASGGILVGTYDPITGVNLVVDGSMKISEDDNKQDVAGEVKMMSGCFYGYDGNVWHVINRSSGVECPKVACDFGSTLLYPGQTGQAYSSSYSADCSEELVDVICNEDGTLGSYEDGILGSGGDYYSYCYNLSSYGIKEAKCGNINGGSYRNLSSTSSNLCKGSTVQDWKESETEFLWTCNIGDSTVECSAKKSFVTHQDGLFTICNPNNDAECLTLMDKNLGASIPGLGEESYGNHYKWGNNYGFPNVTNLPTSEVRAIWDDSYNKKGYYGDTFIIHGNYWDDRMLHRDLWGGSGDVASNGYGYPMTNPTDRQGPCPEGYHVPSIGEWGKVVEWWYARYGGNIGFQGTVPFVYFTDTQARNQFQNDFLIPYAGYRRWSSGRWDGKGTNADLWASFMNQDGGATYLNLIKGGGKVVNTQTLIGMSHGASIRCFKNEVNEAKCGVANCNVYDSLLSNSSDLCKGSSVQNWTSSDTGYSWVCSNGINEVKCSAKKSLVSHDGGLITICNPDNNAECLTLMDKNLGAGVVGTGNESYGKYYQWGNNYGFSSTGGVSSSSIKVDASGYGPNNYYSGSTYILAPETPYDWSSVPNGNLWGGTTNTYWAMRGPCPDGYHVPTSGEWSKLISWWSGSMYNNSCSTMGDQFRDAFLIPFAGYRNFSSTDIYYQGVDAYYWSSSANNGSNADTAYRMYFTSSYGHTKNPNRRTYAFQLRCFKNPENSFADLDMYFLTNGGNAKYYAMMDRNLGATAYMDQPGKTSGDRNGDYYQWGNNYGFPNYGTITNTSNEKVDVSLYGPGNYYSSDTFIIGDDGKGWLREQNENLWGGNGSEIDRQGPCPQGYHIPKKDEFENLVQIWKESTNYPLEHLGKLWSSDTLMPFAGTRSVPSPRSQGVWGIYWLSSSKPEYYASNMEFQALINTVATYSYNNACHSVRCFKNSSTPSITLHPNGGTGALIIVHDGKITKLLEPSKGGAIFGGWYADAGYTSEVHVGDTAPAHLYAKWVDSAFLQCGTYNPSDFKDLDIYFLTDEGTTGHYTLMDRNLGATQVYTGVANVCTYGYHYQWGNNYGFPDNEILKQSNNKVDVSLYGSGNYYSSDIFISVHGESWMIDGNDNLWGGNGSEIDRQGPCPQGYHIPKKAEFQGLISNWEKSISPTSYTGRQRSLDALMPLAGVRDDIYSVRSQGYYGWYWTASRKPDHYAYRVMFGPNEIHINNYSADYVAESVRCFKNSSTPSITLHPNGGTGALIIVHDGKIIKLGIPSNGGATFGGWYSDAGYTSLVHVGDTAPAHLYAKWVGITPISSAKCGSVNEGSYVNLSNTSINLCEEGTVKNRTLSDMEFSWVCDDGDTKVNCSATRLYEVQLLGDDKDMNDFVYGIIRIGDDYIMDRNLGATAVWDGITKRGGKGKDYNYDYDGYFYEWGNNYGFSNDGKCSLMGLSDEDMKEYVCEYDNEGQILPSSCVYGEFICPTNGPWFYTNSKETSYKMWGKRNKLDYNTSGPCPEGWHIPTLAEVENVVSQLKEDQILLYGGGFHSAYGRDMGGNLPSDGSLQYYTGDDSVLSWFWMAGEATLDKTHEYNKYFAPYFEIKCELDKEGVCHDVKYSHAKAHTEIGLPVRCFRNRN